MNTPKKLLAAGLLLVSTAAWAQNTGGLFKDIQYGLKVGGTATHGYTVIPSLPTAIANVQVPEITNNNNGIGYGYTAGLFARKNMRKGYIQAEVTYNMFVLKQVADVTLDVNANPSLVNALPISVAPGLVNATLNATSESTLKSVNVPILLGRRLLNDKVRAYFGPNFIFVTNAQAIRNTSGRLNENKTIGFPQREIPLTTSQTNLLNRFEAADLEVKDVTYALEFGLGVSPTRRMDVDLRYAVPVGGVYKNTEIKGFLGIASLTIGYAAF